MKKAILTVICLIFSTLLLSLSPATVTSFLYDFAYFDTPSASDKALCSRVVDGDTIVIDIEKGAFTYSTYVRLIGVDTPESVHPKKPVEYFGKEASEFTKKHLEGKTVYLTYDWDKQDKYGRLLAYVWLPVKVNGKIKYVLWNAVLILNGYGHAYTVFPFKEEYMEKFQELERYAREHELGMWRKPERTEEAKTYDVRIVYIQYKGKDEYIVIKNFGCAPVNLAGWRIYSKGGQWYTFPTVILQAGESIAVHSGPGASGSLIWTRKYVWNNKGDEAILYDAEGNVVDVYGY